MSSLIGRTLLIITVFWVGFTTIACGAETPDQDIEAVETIEAQAAPATTPTTTPTALPAEIEPVSPLSPLSSPVEETAMPSSIQSDIEPIPGSEDALAAAIADLSARTGLPAEDIRLVSMEAMEWSDASLGCPQEGFMYAQVITPGFLIILEAEGQQYEYHTDQAENVMLCEE